MSSQPENNGINNKSPESTGPVKDASVKVVIMDSGMTARIRISPPQNGGADVTMDGLMKLLTNDNSIKNIDLMRLKSLAADPVYDDDIVVATGTNAVNGTDGTVTFNVRTESKGKPKEFENGKVDYFDLGIIENVGKGQTLCTLTPPTEGTPGYTVKGDIVKPKAGKPAPIVPGPNTELSPDGLRIVSKIDGQFEFDGKRVSVNETYTLNQDVDTSTGHIKVAGNLVIRGMVTSGFTIEAGGFINVVGVVDSATVRAGKDLNLQGGAIGSSISCGGSLKSRFIENCAVSVKGEMRAEYILNSTVRCKKSLKTEGVISKIIGGTCIVMQNVECRTIGSASGVKTKLEIGNDPDLIERQHTLMEMIPELEKQMKSLEPLLKLLNQLSATNRLDETKALTLEKASYTYNTNAETLENARKELEEIGSSISNKNFGKVICPGIIYPGTFVTIGSASYSVTQNLMNTSLYYHEGEIAIGAAK
ncbi:hypothetical protein SAMN02745823_01422 [Sporobacter termitidis DSM 10068]|uniref:Flagellar Assembly Protein A N-terminal region domain-containing protein n=1 Tax=Sporobacter termitidis DSM 10068 TaxID=1123282 RepID=A0A1M5WVX3_9FIRM|nr:FapA family protein [Sporobacter termitidis]SHH91756.1 hypothetical protein SAMN02745823_01422 [Sporobacter termitidis DSM 10068]